MKINESDHRTSNLTDDSTIFMARVQDFGATKLGPRFLKIEFLNFNIYFITIKPN